MTCPRLFDLTGKVAIVTGSSRGIGLAIAAAMPMGPFQMADLAGVDIGWHRDPNRIENVRDALCAIDRWGQKKGAGFYDYDEKRRPSPSPVVQQIIEDFSAKQGVTRHHIDDEEIVERTLYTM